MMKTNLFWSGGTIRSGRWRTNKQFLFGLIEDHLTQLLLFSIDPLNNYHHNLWKFTQLNTYVMFIAIVIKSI